MKVQLDKCEFFKNEVEFLGFVVPENGLKPNPTKVEAITKFPYPKTLRDLRSLLGLLSYYRRFIKGVADLAKPLTQMLRGSHGRVSRTESSRIKISVGGLEKEAIDKLKNALISQEVILSYPNFEREFQLTTDASSIAIGAVLGQEDRPITFISRTLSR